MRISAIQGDPGYNEIAIRKEGIEIFCDGEKVENAHTADTDEGLVRFYVKNEQGRIKTHEKKGVVEIRGL